MERLNDHRHVHNQCARARGCVHAYDFVMTGQWPQRRANLHQSDVH